MDLNSHSVKGSWDGKNGKMNWSGEHWMQAINYPIVRCGFKVNPMLRTSEEHDMDSVTTTNDMKTVWNEMFNEKTKEGLKEGMKEVKKVLKEEKSTKRT